MVELEKRAKEEKRVGWWMSIRERRAKMFINFYLKVRKIREVQKDDHDMDVFINSLLRTLQIMTLYFEMILYIYMYILWLKIKFPMTLNRNFGNKIS